LSDSLTTIASTLTAAGISASVISTTSGSTTTYRLSIEGMTTYTDDNNVLQSLGLIEGDTSDVEGATGSVANTTDGSTAITSSSLISDIYGYSYTSGDSLTISGTTHSGTSVSSTLDITSTTTVSDLLSEIESTFGDVTASVTSAGKIQVVDNTTGTTDLSVSISSSLKGTSTGSSLSFGTFTTGTVQQYVLQDGTDASLTVDGVSVTSSSNTITTAIEGVTLNLTGASSSTTLTLTVSHDVAAIETEISAMISAYNDVMSYVNAQMSYDSTSATTGGVLFGDTTLLQIKQQLQSTILDSVGSGTFSYLSQIGIDLVSNAQLSFDTTTFESVLSSDFEDVVTLFAGGASSSSSQIQYVYSNSSTEAGTYTVIFTQAEGTDTSVAGSIDGYAASGSGDVLSLSNSLSGANGLEVNYLGTYVPTTATITISRGIATLLSSLTDGFTNSTDGTITLVEDGLTSNIGQLATRISQMQSQIDMQISNLTVEYEDMDTYVASMNALQSYLTTQLSSL